MSRRPTVFHIPVCPFSQRLEILLELKGARHEVDFQVVDITKPRDPALLAKTRGRTALPVLEAENGTVLCESIILMQYLDDRFPSPRVARHEPLPRAIEGLLTTMEGGVVAAGYGLVLNQDPTRRDALREALLAQLAELDAFLCDHSPKGTYLFEEFGWAEAVFTPIFMRFWFLEYYEGFDLPATERYARVRAWRDACVPHPAAQQVTREEIVKLYYDYAKGAGNGRLVPGRSVSSFAFEPHWSRRPWPPKDKYGVSASDAELGLV